MSDGQNEQEVLIHSLASVRERETINLYAYGINEPLTYFTHGSNDQNGLIQFKVVQVSSQPTDFPKTNDSVIGVTIQYTNLSLDEPFVIKSHYFYGYLDAYFDEKPLTKIVEMDGSPVGKGETGETKIVFQTEGSAKEVDVFDLDFIPNDFHAIYFHLPVSHE